MDTRRNNNHPLSNALGTTRSLGTRLIRQFGSWDWPSLNGAAASEAQLGFGFGFGVQPISLSHSDQVINQLIGPQSTNSPLINTLTILWNQPQLDYSSGMMSIAAMTAPSGQDPITTSTQSTTHHQPISQPDQPNKPFSLPSISSWQNEPIPDGSAAVGGRLMTYNSSAPAGPHSQPTSPLQHQQQINFSHKHNHQPTPHHLSPVTYAHQPSPPLAQLEPRSVNGPGPGAVGGTVAITAPELMNHKLANVCTNCGTSTTPLWRRDINGRTICNACGKSHPALVMVDGDCHAAGFRLAGPRLGRLGDSSWAVGWAHGLG